MFIQPSLIKQIGYQCRVKEHKIRKGTGREETDGDQRVTGKCERRKHIEYIMCIYDIVRESIYREKTISVYSLNREKLQQAKYKGSNQSNF